MKLTFELPIDFKEKMKNLLEEEADAFFSSYNEKRTAGLRINPLKIDLEKWKEICPFNIEPIPFVEHGFYYDYTKEEPGKHPYHFAGVYYIQEPSAMFVASLLDVKPGEKVLDLCAAPGGKSTHIAAAMKNQGLLITNEIYPKRAKALSENIERFGVTNAVVTNETPEKLSTRFENYFDRILVDAPCSGEGMFRKDHEAVEYWTLEHVIECSQLQSDILDHAYSMLKGGGTLVYSTCTFSPEENEQVIEKFLQKYPDMMLVEIPKEHGIQPGRSEWTESKVEDIQKSARLWPHHINGEGHFVAKLKKMSETPSSRIRTEKDAKKQAELKDFYTFQKQFLKTSFLNLKVLGSQLYALPKDCPELKGLKILRAGLHLGEFKKNRFEPNHALALALSSNDVKQVINLDSTGDEWLTYLKGMTLPGSGKFKGWVLITVDGFPFGWGKEAGGMIKNAYPKGLRIMG